MSYTRRKSALPAACAALALGAGTFSFVAGAQIALAQPAPAAGAAAAPAATNAKIDPRAREVLNRMTAAYKALQSYSGTMNFGGTGVPDLSPVRATIAWKKPNRAVVATTGKNGTVRAVADGTNFYVALPQPKYKYLKVAIPTGAAGDSTVSRAIAQGGAEGLGLMPLIVTGADPLVPVMQGLRSLSLGADSTIAGVAVANIEVVLGAPGGGGPTESLTLSVGKADNLLRQIAIKVTQDNKPITVTETHSDIKVNPTLDDAMFSFTPPAGAKPVESLQPPQPPMHNVALQPGAQPIAFQAKDLDGKALDLDQYKGKVLLLDFWATWCGPCVAEMPNVVAAYDKFKGQGFDIVGISFDQPDARQKLVDFTRQYKMPWRQVFDGRGWKSEVGQLYGVRAIPFTVLIGRDGTIVAINPRGPALETAIQAALAKK